MAASILIAEDDSLQGELLRTILCGQGYRVELVGNGLEAVRQIRRGCFDLALLDFHLPEVDGLATALLLRDLLDDSRRPCLVAFTGSLETLRDRTEAEGETPFDAVVSKPDGIAALLAAIEESLNRSFERRRVKSALERQAVAQDRRIALDLISRAKHEMQRGAAIGARRLS
jgi:CheY-like chemotaxis protein